MSDEDLGGKLILILAFLGCFFGLVGIAPTVFLQGSKVSYTNYVVPAYFTAQDIQSLRYYKDYNITIGTTVTYDWTPTPNYKFYLRWQNPITGSYLYLTHVDWQWWFLQHEHSLKWGNASQTEMPALDFFLACWDPTQNVSITYARCQDITLKAFVSDPDLTRNNLTLAWNTGKIHVGLGFGYSDTEAKLSAWDIVTRLLTFSAPEIFGSGPEGLFLNFILALPIYGLVAYLVYRLVLMAIPFVGG